MFPSKVVEENKTHIFFPITSLFFEKRTVYEIMLKSTVEADRPQIPCNNMAHVLCTLDT